MNAICKTIAFDLAMVLLLVICDYQHANSLGETISAFMIQSIGLKQGRGDDST